MGNTVREMQVRRLSRRCLDFAHQSVVMRAADDLEPRSFKTLLWQLIKRLQQALLTFSILNSSQYKKTQRPRFALGITRGSENENAVPHHHDRMPASRLLYR